MFQTSSRPLGAARHVVVVLSWFGLEDTLACVSSLRAGGPEADVLVVDNGSFDGILPEVTQRWPDVHSLQLSRNEGFTGGMNAGLRWALDRDAATITILNNDTSVPPGTMARLADIAAGGPRAVSPEVTYWDDAGVLWFGEGDIDPYTGLPHHVSAELLHSAGADGLRNSAVLNGCCVTASAQTWRRVGFLDERYFLNFEDSEWSVRARRRGIQLVVDTRSTIKHRVSASFTGSGRYLGLYYYSRNGLIFIRQEGGSARTAGRFLRRHVLPSVIGRRQWGSPLDVVARSLIVAHAGVDHLRRHYGPAPDSVVALAQRRGTANQHR